MKKEYSHELFEKYKDSITIYETGYLDKYWTQGEDAVYVAEDNDVVAYLAVEVHREGEKEILKHFSYMKGWAIKYTEITVTDI